MKLNYDTKELHPELLFKLENNTIWDGQISATRADYHEEDIEEPQREAFLNSVFYFTPGLLRNIVIVEEKKKKTIVDGSFYVQTLHSFLNDKITYKNQYFSELKSAEKRKFKNFRFRTTVFEPQTQEELEYLFNSFRYLF